MDEYHRATARMLSRVGAELVVSDARVRLLLGQAVAEARPPLGLVIAEELQGAVPVEMEDPRPEDLALIQFSSGSTVDPKPVALEHRHLVAQCAALQSLMPEPASSGALGVSWLPLYHDMGLIGALLSAAYYPGPLVLIPPEVFLGQPAIWLRAISRFRGTISPAPNFAYALCLKRVSQRELEGVDLRSWRYALNGAEPVSPEVLRRFSERYGPLGFDPASLMPVYGLSEASLAVTFSPRRSPAKTVSVDPRALAERSRAEAGTYELASVGRPVPGVEVEIRGQDGRALPELYLCGREKDLVIIRGANHAPQEFEVCLEGVPGVRPGCAVALGFTPEGGTSEELLILAERRGDASLDAAVEEAVRKAVVERTGIRPHTVKMLEPGTLPRTSSGKMRRREALRRFQAGQLTPPLRMGVMRFAAEVARSTLALARSRLKRSREGR